MLYCTELEEKFYSKVGLYQSSKCTTVQWEGLQLRTPKYHIEGKVRTRKLPGIVMLIFLLLSPTRGETKWTVNLVQEQNDYGTQEKGIVAIRVTYNLSIFFTQTICNFLALLALKDFNWPEGAVKLTSLLATTGHTRLELPVARDSRMFWSQYFKNVLNAKAYVHVQHMLECNEKPLMTFSKRTNFRFHMSFGHTNVRTIIHSRIQRRKIRR